jgi:hypothetical protein
MTDWAPVVAVGISAPIAAVAALGGAWLQGRLSRQAEAEAEARREAHDHTAIVRTTVADFLAALDIAALAGIQLVHPPQKFTGKRSVAGRLQTELDEQALSERVASARATITTALSKMNEVKVLEPELLPDSVVSEMREIVSAFSGPAVSLAGDLDPDKISEIYSLHSATANAYSAWINSPKK